MALRLTVVSDIHRDINRLEKLITVINSGDYFIFCGDGASDVMQLSGAITVPTVCVRGNNDFYCNWGEDAKIDLCGMKVLVTHGHKYGVKRGLTDLAQIAELNGYGLVCYGHTHRYADKTINGVRLINPGAVCNGSYAVITLNGKTVTNKQYEI